MPAARASAAARMADRRRASVSVALNVDITTASMCRQKPGSSVSVRRSARKDQILLYVAMIRRARQGSIRSR